MRDFRWMQLFWDGETGGTAGGTDSGGDKGAETPPPSLRAQLAGQLDEADRGGFSKWADTYTTDKEFVLGAVNMRSQFDARVPVPGQDAKPEEVGKYFERVGKPGKAADYTYDWGKGEDGKPVQLSDSERADFEGFKEFAHGEHLTQKQFEKALGFYYDRDAKVNAGLVDVLNRAQDNSAKELKAEWGPDYDANIAASVDGGLAFAHDAKAWEEFVNLPLTGPNGMQIKVGDHPTFMKAWAKVGRATTEDTRVRNLTTSGEAASIQAEITRVEQEAITAGKSTAVEPYFTRLNTLYKKLNNNTPMSGFGRSGFGA